MLLENGRGWRHEMWFCGRGNATKRGHKPVGSFTGEAGTTHQKEPIGTGMTIRMGAGSQHF